MTENDPQPLVTGLTAWETGDLAKSMERVPERPEDAGLPAPAHATRRRPAAARRG